MLWFTVWSVITVGWLAGVFFGLRRLWRQVVALGRELESLADLATRFANALDQVPEPEQAAGPSVFTDPYDPDLRARLTARRRRRAERRAAKQLRHQRVYHQWAVIAGPRD